MIEEPRAAKMARAASAIESRSRRCISSAEITPAETAERRRSSLTARCYPRARPPRGRRRGYASRPMPPEPRFVPRFAAEPSQDLLPYGRWAETLRAEFLAACLPLEGGEDDLGEPGEPNWYPDRTWGGRTYLPATAQTTTRHEL